MKHHDLVDIDCLFRFLPESGKSLAVSLLKEDLKKGPLFLPLSQIEYIETGRQESGRKVITVTMPQWLAEEKGMV